MTELLRLLVSGDRNWTNRIVVYDALKQLSKDTTIIHGCANGLDKIAAECALELGLRIDKPPTPGNKWGGYPYLSKFGRAGGPIRNTQMLKEGHPDQCWAWHNDIWISKGTKNMVEQSIRAGLPTFVFTDDGVKHQASLIHGEIHLENYGEPVTLEDGIRAQLKLDEMLMDLSYRDIAVMHNLPDHPGVCDCEACNIAYGKRR